LVVLNYNEDTPMRLGRPLTPFTLTPFRLVAYALKRVQYEAYADHLRHAKVVGLREDKDPRGLVEEQTTT